MISILFVDDDQSFLDGIARQLRPYRSEWSAEYALGGPAAMEHLLMGSFDVVVSDFRMPEVDGLELLGAVRQTHPQAVRVLLTGQAELQMLARTMAVAHQFITKPVDPQALRDAINRSLQIRSRLTDPALLATIAGIGTLPSPSESVTRLRQLMDHEVIDLDAVSEVVCGDSAMASKVLHLVNSAFFGLPAPLTDPDHAVRYLGTSTVRDLLITADMFSALGSLSLQAEYCLSGIQNMGSARARLGFELARTAGYDVNLAREAWVAGLLSSLGLVALVAARPDLQPAIYASVELRDPSALDGSELVPALGAYFSEIWGLPGEIVEAIAFQSDRPTDGRPLTTLCQLAVVVDQFRDESELRAALEPFPLDDLGLRLDDVLAQRTAVAQP